MKHFIQPGETNAENPQGPTTIETTPTTVEYAATLFVELHGKDPRGVLGTELSVAFLAGAAWQRQRLNR